MIQLIAGIFIVIFIFIWVAKNRDRYGGYPYRTPDPYSLREDNSSDR